MSQVVVDASVALAWCFPDEGSAYADDVLVALEARTILTPAVWTLEIANALLVGERAKRIRQPEIQRFMSLLDSLSFVQDTQSVNEHVGKVLPLAREHALSAYDASYLELSIRHSASLATLDGRMKRAAIKAGVAIFNDRIKSK